jgi:hypothetical protein
VRRSRILPSPMPRYLLLIDDVRTIDADIPLELTVADEFEHEGRWWRVSALRDDVDVEAGARAVAVEGALPRYFVFGSRLAEVDLYWPHLSVANVCTFYGDVPPSVPRAAAPERAGQPHPRRVQGRRPDRRPAERDPHHRGLSRPRPARGRMNRTQEVAGSSPASSIPRSAAKG